MNVLLVTPSVTVLRGICNHLRQLGYDKVARAQTAAKALQRLDEEDFDFVVAGWDLPDQAGLTLVREIRDRWALPTLMISPYDDPDRVLRAVRAGVDGYLLRPLSAEALASSIHRISARTDGATAPRDGATAPRAVARTPTSSSSS